MLALRSTVTSRYRQVEATVSARPSEHDNLNVSYVWSRARGDLNALADTFVRFERPVIRPNTSGILPSDVPNRVVAWGTFALPVFGLTVSPVVDAHTGLPYSVVDTVQNYVGTPNTARFSTFFSLDLQVYKEFDLGAVPLLAKLKGKRFRFGIFSLNVTSHKNPLDVF